MCKWGTLEDLRLDRPRPVSGRLVVPVDQCIQPLVQLLNDHGVRTVGCCCGHGKAPGFISFEDPEGIVREIPLRQRKGHSMTDDTAIPEAALEDAKQFVRIRVALQEAALASAMVTAMKTRHGVQCWQAALDHNSTKHAEERARVQRLYHRCRDAMPEHRDHWMLTASSVPSVNGWRQVQADLRVELHKVLTTAADMKVLQADLDAHIYADGAGIPDTE